MSKDRPIDEQPTRFHQMAFKTLDWLATRLCQAHLLQELATGMDFFQDLSQELPKSKLEVVFDIGANIGQSVCEFLKAGPSARIFCFEPTADTFARLEQPFAFHPQVKCFRLAFGSEKGTARLLRDSHSATRNRIIAGEAVSDGEFEEVPVETVDHFCAQQGVDSISCLKIDTEGHDLEVLKGARGMLAALKIDIVRVEASMNPENRLHVPLGEFQAYLEPFGYRLYKFYEQKREWPSGQPNLRRTNPVFISPKTIEANLTRKLR